MKLTFYYLVSTKKSHKLKQKYSFHLLNFNHDSITKIIQIDLFMSNFEKVAIFFVFIRENVSGCLFQENKQAELVLPQFGPNPRVDTIPLRTY